MERDITYCQELQGFEDGINGELKDYPQSDIYIGAWQRGRDARYRHHKQRLELKLKEIGSDEQT